MDTGTLKGTKRVFGVMLQKNLLLYDSSKRTSFCKWVRRYVFPRTVHASQEPSSLILALYKSACYGKRAAYIVELVI